VVVGRSCQAGSSRQRRVMPGQNLRADVFSQPLMQRGVRHELDRIAIGTFTGPAGTFRQRTEITKAQRDILAQLGIDPPPRIYQLTPASP